MTRARREICRLVASGSSLPAGLDFRGTVGALPDSGANYLPCGSFLQALENYGPVLGFGRLRKKAGHFQLGGNNTNNKMGYLNSSFIISCDPDSTYKGGSGIITIFILSGRKLRLETFHLLTWALGLIFIPEEEMVNFPGNVLCGTVAETRALE